MDLSRVLNTNVLRISSILDSNPLTINQSEELSTHWHSNAKENSNVTSEESDEDSEVIELKSAQYHIVPLASDNINTDPFGIDLLQSLLNEFGRTKEAEGKLSKTRNAGVELLKIYKELVNGLKEVEEAVFDEKDCIKTEEKFRLLKIRIRKTKKRHEAKKYQRGFRSREEVRDLAGAFEEQLSIHLKNLLNNVTLLHKHYQRKMALKGKLKKKKLYGRIEQNPISILSNGINWKMQMLQEYFCLFRNGFSLFDDIVTETQLKFVKSNMVEGLTFEFVEAKADFFQQWKIAVALMPRMNLSLNNIEASAHNRDFMSCTVKASFIITRRFIATLYPHMLSNEFFVNSVIGKTFYVESYMQFIYEPFDKKIRKIEAKSHMTNGWINLIGDRKLVKEITAVEKAKLRQDGFIQATEIVYVPDELDDLDCFVNLYD